MKKLTAINLIATSLVCYIIISGYHLGPGTNGWDCTGAETGLGNPTGCASGSGCHSTTATAAIAVSIVLDSTGGLSTTHYSGGKTYTVTLTGKNNGSTNQPAFGFQMGCIAGSAAVTTPTNAGTWSAAVPPGTHYAAAQAGLYVVNVVEQSNTSTPTTGTGGNGTTYVRSFVWTAPAAGTGTISFWGAVNAVNNNGTNDAGDKWNTNHAVINEWPAANAVNTLSENEEIKVFPNPVSDNLNLQLNNIDNGSYFLSVYDLSGKKIESRNVQIGNSSQMENINVSSWNTGMYILFLEKDNFRQKISIIKE